MVFPCTARIWLYQKPVDMRRSFDGLAAIAQNVLSLPAASGDWFVFVNRRRTQMKTLYFDTGGYCIWAKRLERAASNRSRITAIGCSSTLRSCSA